MKLYGHMTAAGAGLLAALLAAQGAGAAVLTEGSALVFSGRFQLDDNVGLHDLEVVAPYSLEVVFESFSYAGGTLRDGTYVAAGGFDPIISLFDSGGRLIDVGDDGLRRNDPVSGDPYDAFLALTLSPGQYRLAVTQYDNFPNAPLGGFLADGFNRDGEGNFTGGPCGALSFCDSGGYSRSAEYVVEVATLSTIPVPAGLTLLLGATAMLGALRIARRHQA